MCNVAPLFLRIPVAFMDQMADPLAFTGLTPEAATALKDDYSEMEIQGIRNGLDYAIKHPNYDFAALIPGIAYSNGQILEFLTKLHHLI
jgi:hypothetical protein